MYSQVSQCESAGDGVEISEVQADQNSEAGFCAVWVPHQ